jgi:hypothetical protein
VGVQQGVGRIHAPARVIRVTEARSPSVADDRVDPPFLAGDRDSLESWLELYRATVPIKVGGLTPEQLCRPAVPPSTLTLLGIVRHLTKVERYWFANVVSGDDAPILYCGEDEDGDFNDIAAESALADLERFDAELEASRDRARAVTDLDAPLRGKRRGRDVNLRWVYAHMVEEYARHLGHADLIRECVDGVTGY